MTISKIKNDSAYPVSLANPQTTSFGTAFKIKYGGIESYLIALTHHSDEETIKKSCFHRIIEKCSTLYTENGVFIFVTSSHLNVPEVDHGYQHLKYRFSLDDAITLKAWARNIPIISLDFDQGIPERDQDKDLIIQIMNTTDPSFTESELMAAAAKAAQNPAFIASHNHIKMGNIGPLKAARNRVSMEDPSFCLDLKREKRWAKILIPVLKNTKRPICIALGHIHVVGKGSLSDRFKKAGFQVKLIRASCESDQEQFSSPGELTSYSLSSSPGWLPMLMEQASGVSEVANTVLPKKKPKTSKLLKVKQVKRPLIQSNMAQSKRARKSQNSKTQRKITDYFFPLSAIRDC
jgi:hypothetical protein